MIDKRNGSLAPKQLSVMISKNNVPLDKHNITDHLSAVSEGTIGYLVNRAKRCKDYSHFRDGYFVKVNYAIQSEMFNTWGPHFKPEDIVPTE